jgi:hypothetical protein
MRHSYVLGHVINQSLMAQQSTIAAPSLLPMIGRGKACPTRVLAGIDDTP